MFNRSMSVVLAGNTDIYIIQIFEHEYKRLKTGFV